MGVIGPNNQLPGRRAGRGALHSALYDHEDDLWTENGQETDEQSKLPPEADTSKTFEALSLFPQPKSLLIRVIQVATSSNRIRVRSSRPLHSKKMSSLNPSCILNVALSDFTGANAVQNNRRKAKEMWADSALARGDDIHRHSKQASDGGEDGCGSRLPEAEGEDHFGKTTLCLCQRVRAVFTCVSCHLVQELELLDKNNNPLTHAKYNQEEVQEAGKRERRPLPLEVPQYLEEHMREYLAQVSLHLMCFLNHVYVHYMAKSVWAHTSLCLFFLGLFLVRYQINAYSIDILNESAFVVLTKWFSDFGLQELKLAYTEAWLQPQQTSLGRIGLQPDWKLLKTIQVGRW